MEGRTHARRPDSARSRRGVTRRKLFAAASVAGTAGWAMTRHGAVPRKKQAPKDSAGYRETEHVRTAYRLSRF